MIFNMILIGIQTFHRRKSIENCPLENGGYFASAAMGMLQFIWESAGWECGICELRAKWYGKYEISQCLVHLFLFKFGFNALSTVHFIPEWS